ncbi:MAG: GNAT family N-acetyltransferase [Lentimicrobiaceae bacterium]|jgi:predicted acetyltransferase|nr:GNAT family N-acetyltransferase [Lentimicrobiaceae bacterium]
MIRLATTETTPFVKNMWKTCFGDTNDYMNMYFEHKYKPENTLIYFEGETAVASLQILSYTITFYETEIPAAYLSGICTLPEFRGKGYASKLISKAHEIIRKRGIYIVVLIPETNKNWLFKFYNRFGYEKVFKKDKKTIPLKQILETSSDSTEAYIKFDALFRDKDFCVQKNSEDFEAIVIDFKNSNCPNKTNLTAMAAILDAEKALKHYAEKNPHNNFNVKINNSFSCVYHVENGKVDKTTATTNCEIEADSRFLCRLLFGYETNKLPQLYRVFFPKKQPIINLMLE